MKPSCINKEYFEFLSIATYIAKEAGAYLTKARNELIMIKKNTQKDLKIKADKESENLIINKLIKETGLCILTEESGKINAKRILFDNSLFWIVDPLDGTINYRRGIPFYTISIGLWKKTEPVLGVIFDIIRNDLYSGIVNYGAFLNGSKIKTGKIKKIQNAVLCTGFPSSMAFDNKSLYTFFHCIQNFKKIRCIGCASLSLAYVASGKADAYFERNIRLWDVAAGLAIVKAAGGFINLKKTISDDTFDVFASNLFLSKVLNIM